MKFVERRSSRLGGSDFRVHELRPPRGGSEAGLQGGRHVALEVRPLPCGGFALYEVAEIRKATAKILISERSEKFLAAYPTEQKAEAVARQIGAIHAGAQRKT